MRCDGRRSLLRRSDSSAEFARQGPLVGLCARSEKTGFAGSARSPSQTARFTDLFPATASVGPPSGPIFWFLAHLSVGFALADGGPVFLQAASQASALRRHSPPGPPGFATRTRSANP